MSNKGYMGKSESFAKGGETLGRTRDFLKEPDQFTDDRKPPKPTEDVDQDYVKTGKGGKLSKMTGDKELPCKKPKS